MNTNGTKIWETVKRKLSSRKLWMAVASFVSMLLIALGQPEATATQVSALIMAGASVVGYIIAEGLADAAGAGSGSGTDAGTDAGEEDANE